MTTFLKRCLIFMFALGGIKGFSQSNHKIYFTSLFNTENDNRILIQMDWAVKNELKSNPDSKEPIKLLLSDLWGDRLMFQHLMLDTFCDSTQLERIFFDLESKYSEENSNCINLWKNFLRWQNQIPLDVKKRIEFSCSKNFLFGIETAHTENDFRYFLINFLVTDFLSSIKEKGFQTQIQFDALNAWKIAKEKAKSTDALSFNDQTLLQVLRDSFDVVYSEIGNQLNWKQKKEFSMIKEFLENTYYISQDNIEYQIGISNARILEFPKYLDSVSQNTSVYVIDADDFFFTDSSISWLKSIPDSIRNKYSKEYQFFTCNDALVSKLENNISTLLYCFKYLGIEHKLDRRYFMDSNQVRKSVLHTDTNKTINVHEFFQKLKIGIEPVSYLGFYKRYKLPYSLSDTAIKELNYYNDTAVPELSNEVYFDDRNRIEDKFCIQLGGMMLNFNMTQLNSFLDQNNYSKVHSIQSAVLDFAFYNVHRFVIGQSVNFGSTSLLKSNFVTLYSGFPVYSGRWIDLKAGTILGNQNFTLSLPGTMIANDITKSQGLIQYTKSSYSGGLFGKLSFPIMPDKLGVKLNIEAGGLYDFSDKRWELNGHKINTGSNLGNFSASGWFLKAGLSVRILKVKSARVIYD